MKVGEYELVNEAKLTRVIDGNMSRGGKTTGGVGVEASDAQILAGYDKLAGLILKDGLKVKPGCFWDFDERKPFDKPELSFEVSVDDALVEVTEVEAKVLDSAKKKRDELKADAKSKPKGKRLRRKKKEDKPE